MKNFKVAKKYSTKVILRKLSHDLEERIDDGTWERRFILKKTDDLCLKLGGKFEQVYGA